MLRYACGVLTHALTVILAPYFVHTGKCDAAFEESAWCPAPYVMACLWVLITTLLLSVQVRARLLKQLRKAVTVCSTASARAGARTATAVREPAADNPHRCALHAGALPKIEAHS